MQTDLLKGIKILVTRPAHQAQPLCDMIQAQGGQAIRLPVINIEPLALSKKVVETIAKSDAIDFAVFISPNAVEHGIEQLLKYSKIPDTLKLVTIGQASAKKIQELLGRMPDISPTKQYNSEALLALDSLQKNQLNNKRIIIFRGHGGRELLAKTLTQRGAHVSYAEVYQRVQPRAEHVFLNSLWSAAKQPDIITLSSNEGLHNLLKMSSDPILKRIYQTPLIVVTEKMRQQAQKLGFKKAIIIAEKASNMAMLDAVIQYFTDH